MKKIRASHSDPKKKKVEGCALLGKSQSRSRKRREECRKWGPVFTIKTGKNGAEAALSEGRMGKKTMALFSLRAREVKEGPGKGRGGERRSVARRGKSGYRT